MNVVQPPVLTPVRDSRDPLGITERTCLAIREAIMDGRIPPGGRLRQLELAAQLGVNQRTVREALSRLVAEGLAESEPRKGVRATLLPLEDLEDVFDLRALLEGPAFAAAATRISAADLAHMRDLLPLTSTSADPASIPLARQTNREFHWLAIRASGRRHLIRMLTQLWQMTVSYVLTVYDTDAARVGSSQHDRIYHARIVEALAAHDGTLAGSLAAEHVRMTWDSIRARLERKGRASDNTDVPGTSLPGVPSL